MLKLTSLRRSLLFISPSTYLRRRGSVSLRGATLQHEEGLGREFVTCEPSRGGRWGSQNCWRSCWTPLRLEVRWCTFGNRPTLLDGIVGTTVEIVRPKKPQIHGLEWHQVSLKTKPTNLLDPHKLLMLQMEQNRKRGKTMGEKKGTCSTGQREVVKSGKENWLFTFRSSGL